MRYLALLGFLLAYIGFNYLAIKSEIKPETPTPKKAPVTVHFSIYQEPNENFHIENPFDSEHHLEVKDDTKYYRVNEFSTDYIQGRDLNDYVTGQDLNAEVKSEYLLKDDTKYYRVNEFSTDYIQGRDLKEYVRGKDLKDYVRNQYLELITD